MGIKGLGRSLRSKMIVIISAIVLVSIGVVTAVSIFSMRKQMEEQIKEEQILLAQSFAEVVQQFFDDAKGMVRTAAHMPEVRDVSSAASISEEFKGIPPGLDLTKREIFRNIIDHFGDFRYIEQVTAEGTNILMEPYEQQLQLARINFSDRDWFQGALRKRDAHISEVYISSSLNQPVVAISHPLTDDQGRLLGVLVGGMTLDRLNNLCAHLTFKETGYAYLVDQRGACAAHRDEDLTRNLTSFVEIPMVQKVMAGEAGVGRYFDPRRQEEVFSAFTPIGDTGWGLIVVQDPKEAFARVRATTTTISVLALLLLTVAVAITLQVANSITRPINLLVGEVKKMSEGDLTGEIKISSQDEIGDLANNFNKMVANLNTDLLNINAAAEQVAAGANQLAVSSQSLSDGTTEQASSIQEITATVTQIAAQTKENAVNANQAAELTLKAKEIAVEGNRQMEEMVEAMAQINDSSSNISKVIKAIDDLAFQTNILALNAAVEAARAGQHGKGFAVVAEEVRNLAARSANAAQETTVMIEDSIHKAEVGMKIARKTAEELDQIEETVNQAAALVAKIATASNEQATGIAQINQAIDQVSEVVQSNSATAEETASASEELSSQAELMKNSVRKFKLKKGKQVMGGTDVFTLEKIRPFAKVVGKGNHYPLYGEEEIVRESVPADGENSLFSISRQEDNYGKY